MNQRTTRSAVTNQPTAISNLLSIISNERVSKALVSSVLSVPPQLWETEFGVSKDQVLNALVVPLEGGSQIKRAQNTIFTLVEQQVKNPDRNYISELIQNVDSEAKIAQLAEETGLPLPDVYEAVELIKARQLQFETVGAGIDARESRQHSSTRSRL